MQQPDPLKKIIGLEDRLKQIRKNPNEWSILDIGRQAWDLYRQLENQEPMAGLISAWCDNELGEQELALQKIAKVVPVLEQKQLSRPETHNAYVLACEIYRTHNLDTQALHCLLKLPELMTTFDYYVLASDIFFRNDMWEQIAELHTNHCEHSEYIPAIEYLFYLVRNTAFKDLKETLALANNRRAQSVSEPPKNAKLTYFKTEQRTHWQHKLEQAHYIVSNYAPSQWEYTKDGVAYRLQLDQTYRACFIDAPENLGHGATPKEALANIESKEKPSSAFLDANLGLDTEDLYPEWDNLKPTAKAVTQVPNLGLLVDLT